MKNLLEGSCLLDTDVIYKAKQQILPAPTVINMNGSSIQSIFKWCHEEIPAFKTRVVFLKMHIPLQNRVESKDFQYLAKSGKEFIYILTKCFMDLQNETTVAIKDCTSDICIWVKNLWHLCQSQQCPFIVYCWLWTGNGVFKKNNNFRLLYHPFQYISNNFSDGKF